MYCAIYVPARVLKKGNFIFWKFILHLTFDLPIYNWLASIRSKTFEYSKSSQVEPLEYLKNYVNFNGWKLELKAAFFTLFYPILFNFGVMPSHFWAHLAHNSGTCKDLTFIFSRVINNTSLNLKFLWDSIPVIFGNFKDFLISLCQKNKQKIQFGQTFPS